MLSYLECLYAVILSVVVVLFTMYLLNRTLDETERKRANSVNGWQLSILGSIYAVALGFMLSDAWIAYQTATNDVRNEAAAALTIYRTAKLLPHPCAVLLQDSVHQYVQTVDTVEWPTMQAHAADFQGSAVVRTMWNIVSECEGAAQLPARAGVVDALEALQIRRDSRLEDYQGHLPIMMWSVLVFGALIVILCSSLLGNEKKGIHCFHVISLTVLIAVMLLAISDLDRPFEGATRVSPQAFETVLAEMQYTQKQ